VDTIIVFVLHIIRIKIMKRGGPSTRPWETRIVSATCLKMLVMRFAWPAYNWIFSKVLSRVDLHVVYMHSPRNLSEHPMHWLTCISTGRPHWQGGSAPALHLRARVSHADWRISCSDVTTCDSRLWNSAIWINKHFNVWHINQSMN